MPVQRSGKEEFSGLVEEVLAGFLGCVGFSSLMMSGFSGLVVSGLIVPGFSGLFESFGLVDGSLGFVGAFVVSCLVDCSPWGVG